MRKSARLRHRSLVEGLFAHPKGAFEFPLRIVWRVLNKEELAATFRDHQPDRIGPLQILITVPKKKRRHAVDRVLVRRRIRESFRLHSIPLKELVESQESIRTISMAIIYQSNENLPFADISRAMEKIMARISRKVTGGEKPPEEGGKEA